jgi:hypothetical protein
MNHQTSDTPETDTQHAQFPMGGFTLDFARKLERERDQWVAKAAELSAERESNAMQALVYKAERDEARKLFESSKRARASLSEACDHLQRERDSLREALSACMEDSIELLGEREWWKDESRSGYAERYAQTAVNISEAQALLATLQK